MKTLVKVVLLGFVIFAIANSSHLAFARNVSYVGGWTLLSAYDDDSFSSLAHYTPHRTFSIGYRYEYFRDKEWHYNGLQLNYLAKRWNNPDSQANFYVLSSVGNAYSNYGNLDKESETAGFIGISTDWENRRFFVSYENRYVHAGSIDESFTQKVRVGVTPYVEEFGGLHTWLMLELNHNDHRDENITLTPLVRFFKNNIMTEFGWTIDGEAMVNLRILF